MICACSNCLGQTKTHITGIPRFTLLMWGHKNKTAEAKTAEAKTAEAKTA
jgi:hypothetical protein